MLNIIIQLGSLVNLVYTILRPKSYSLAHIHAE